MLWIAIANYCPLSGCAACLSVGCSLSGFDIFGSLGITVVERVYGGILVASPPKYPHIFL